MKRFPRLQISFWDQVFSFMGVPQEERGGANQIRQMRHRCSLETFELNLRRKNKPCSKLTFRRTKGASARNGSPKPPRHAFADFAQLSRAATPQTITGPKLPYGAPPGPVMYPSLANFKMRNSSVLRPR